MSNGGRRVVAFQTAFLTLAAAAVAQVKVTDNVSDEGQSCYKVETPSATYFFQKKAAGFSSIVDKGGKDWVGYHAGGGSGGEYRGIPNLGGCCHPGYPTSNEGVAMTSTLTESKADRATVVSVSGDGKWETRWEFCSTHATLTVVKAPRTYWVLYEGVPGGSWSKTDDYLVMADGTKKAGGQADFGNDLPSPEWVCFGDGPTGRGLLYVHHTDDNVKDVFWSFGDMTVFGFGRTCGGECFGLTETPNRFSIAITDNTDYAQVKQLASAIAGGSTTVPSLDRSPPQSRLTTDRAMSGGRVHDLGGRRMSRTGAPAAACGACVVSDRYGVARVVAAAVRDRRGR